MQVTRHDTDKEPVFHATLPRSFYMALINGYLLKTIVDLSPGNGALAEAALLKRCGHAKVGYFGICLSEAHMNSLRERLELFVLKEMTTEGSQLYVARCAEALAPEPQLL
eukprot:11693274-Prorocentrum_lima.AAC.1